MSLPGVFDCLPNPKSGNKKVMICILLGFLAYYIARWFDSDEDSAKNIGAAVFILTAFFELTVFRALSSLFRGRGWIK
jgi:hypothetical protein